MMPAIPETTVERLPLGTGVRLIHASPHGLIAVDKPAGLMSHPNEPKDVRRCLLNADYDYESEFFSWNVGGAEQRAWLVNRLDSPTSGLLLLALNAGMNGIAKRLFSAHKVRKTYYALVKQAPFPAAGVWKDFLPVNSIYPKGKQTKVGQKLLAHTNYKVIQRPVRGRPIALIELMPITGRTHQLRIQCKNHNHPIIGDRTYGDFSFNRKVASEAGQKRLMLHSAEITLQYTYQGKNYDFCATSELPDAFANVMQSHTGG